MCYKSTSLTALLGCLLFFCPMLCVAESTYYSSSNTSCCGQKSPNDVNQADERKNGIRIACDKVSYKPGEDIEISVSNSTDMPVFFYDERVFWDLEKYKWGKWKNFKDLKKNKSISHFSFNTLGEKCAFVLYEMPEATSLRPGEILTRKWNQKFCLLKKRKGDMRLVWDPVNIPKGRYRFSFRYSHMVNQKNNQIEKEDAVFAVSDSFVIE